MSGDWKSAKLDLSVYPSQVDFHSIMDSVFTAVDRLSQMFRSCLIDQEVNKLRKLMYLKFKAWATKVRSILMSKGYWTDASCPITGGCMFGAFAFVLSVAFVLSSY